MKYVMHGLSVLLALMALGAAVFGITLAFENRNATPVLVKPSTEALATGDRLLSALCRGEYDAAEALILGHPDLGISREPADAVGQLFWDAWQESLQYEAVGESTATNSGVAQTYRLRYLDLSSVTAGLNARSQALLEERVAQAEDVSQIYDENNEYREDLVMEVLYEAARQGLAEDAEYLEKTFTVSFVFQDGRWYAVGDDQLLGTITGALLG